MDRGDGNAEWQEAESQATVTGNQVTALEQEKRLRYILDIIEEGVWEWNGNSGQVRRNPSWYRMLAYDASAGLAEDTLTWENIIHPEDYPAVMECFEDYIFGRSNQYRIEYRCRKGDGDYLWIRDQGRIVERNPDGSVALMIGAHLDIDAEKRNRDSLRQQNEMLASNQLTIENLIEQRTRELTSAKSSLENSLIKIERLRITDPLTGIYNRYKLEEELDSEIGRAKRYGSPLSVTLFDIDYFKRINDQHGHHMGDLVLQRVSRLVRANLRGSDTLGRWGGDEFVIILPGVALAAAQQGLEKVRALIAADREAGIEPVTCSFGVAEFQDNETPATLLRRADSALYDAKKHGRNRVSTTHERS
ncbi:MAG: diguanylate cyclase [Gammaproteobacteria bacterium]|uniref:sensor domain-containing diguanylate cyclase n=1 Tax=Pseudomaricurvus alcaniphilus TaxID=1166482 RepID=UPI00140B8D03|nr:sensor domain-containing diguanylate cyclase [Pseudomaricurvus alcaniphilus]MBR9909610.1 diguanylate cyclase [Gammaproteobacteria bacterium]NHN36974.1 diguanylate cyclase [Pseudomaricurvus alcaniphilus]